MIEGTSFKFVHHSLVVAANEGGILTETAWTTYQDGRQQHLTKHLNMCKDNKMNVCKLCEAKYFLTNNDEGSCTKGDVHVP